MASTKFDGQRNAGWPRVILTAKSKGGVGASTLALCIADQYDLAEVPLHIFQVDNQARLEKSLGRNVTSINIALADVRRDPALLVRAFDPLGLKIEEIRSSDEAVLVDFGPTETTRFLEWARLAEFDDDLTSFGLPSVVLVPAVAEPEAIRAAANTLREFEQSLPSVRRIFVHNERDGAFERLHPASEASRVFREELQPLLTSADQLQMPAIEAGSWRWFEATCLRFTDAVGLTTEEVMALTGLSRSESKIIRGDVAAWLQTMQQELTRAAVLP